MKLLLHLAVVIVALCQNGEAGQNFPPEAQFLTMQTFRKINPDIEEDWTDYMQELAGEFTTCDEIFVHQGHWEILGKRAPNGDRVGALIDYVPSDTMERQGIDAIAKQIFDKWIETFPFNEQIRIADHFGCSVAPGCAPRTQGNVRAPRGYAVVGCGFYPTCKNDGCLEDPTIPPPPRVRALAFTPEQYAIAEGLFYRKQWDRSHFLEDLSGTETDCSMIGRSTWQFTNAQSQARLRNLDIYGRFGFTVHTGNTPDPMMRILRDIRDEEQNENQGGRQAPGNQFGCSIIPDCSSRTPGRPGDREQMYVVVSCLFSRTNIRQDFGRGGGATLFSRAGGDNQPSRTLPARPPPNQPIKSPIQPQFLPDRRQNLPPHDFLPNRPNPVKPLPRRGDQGDQPNVHHDE